MYAHLTTLLISQYRLIKIPTFFNISIFPLYIFLFILPELRHVI